jgi:hypothetical protein
MVVEDRLPFQLNQYLERTPCQATRSLSAPTGLALYPVPQGVSASAAPEVNHDLRFAIHVARMRNVRFLSICTPAGDVKLWTFGS